jgi:hypothetical protein
MRVILRVRGGITATITSRRRRILVAATLATSLAVAGLGGGPDGTEANAEGRYSKSRRVINSGLTLIRMYDNKLHARIKILRVDPTTFVTLDVALSNNTLPMRETTTSMVSRHGAIAGINASFGNSWGRPLGVFAEDGTLKASPYVPGGTLALARGSDGAHIGHPRLTIKAKNLNTGAKWRIRDWNDPNENRDRVAGFTSAGGDVVDPEGNSCAMRLVAKGALRWNADHTELARRYKVAKQICADAPLALGKGIVLGARRGSPGAAIVQGNNADQYVRLSWSVGWAKSIDAVGGSPVLISDGNLIDQCEGYVCKRHPRTGVGRLPNGKVLLVTVDGRQSDSYGMTVLQFARFFKHMGATSAINLDGGGSSTMVLRGNVINSPSDPSGQREVSSAIIVHAGPDPDEPDPKAPRVLTPALDSFIAASDDTGVSSGELAMEDPASTGGLLDALAKGGFGGRAIDLDGSLDRALKRFRRSTR